MFSLLFFFFLVGFYFYFRNGLFSGFVYVRFSFSFFPDIVFVYVGYSDIVVYVVITIFLAEACITTRARLQKSCDMLRGF